MTTNYYQTHDITHNNPNDLETLLFLDIYSSLDLDPADIPDVEKVEAATAVEAGDEQETDEEFSPFEGIGVTLTDPNIVARFNGVRRDLLREIRGGMCTVEQAQRYLEHLEITLLLEQDGE